MDNSCISTVTDKLIVFSENKSEFRIKNDSRRKIEKHKVDDCLIKGEEFKKCDWLVIDVDSGKEIYIELKGKDIAYAVEQLKTSVKQLSKNENAKKLAYVIGTRSPLTSPDIQIEAKKALTTHRIVLRVKTMKHTEIIEKLIADLSI